MKPLVALLLLASMASAQDVRTPIRVLESYNQLAAANTDAVGDFATTQEVVVFRASFALVTTASVVNVITKWHGQTFTEALNDATSITAGRRTVLSFVGTNSCTYNIQCATATKFSTLVIEELRSSNSTSRCSNQEWIEYLPCGSQTIEYLPCGSPTLGSTTSLESLGSGSLGTERAMSLDTFFADRLIAGLTKRAIRTPSQWAEAYRRTKDGKPWSFRRYPWTREMHDSKAEFNVGQKAAQVAYTETVLDVCFHANDILSTDVLYVLPNQAPDASDFSKARFDSAVEASPHLKALYSDVCNVGHKRAGTSNFYIRGSQSRAGLKSVPVGVIALDEVEEMEQDNIPLALERVSGQLVKLIWAISTPKLSGHGINKLFNESSQDHFHFPAPCCGRMIEFTFPECLEIVGDDPDSKRIHESFLKCPSCHHSIEHDAKVDFLKDGVWVPSVSDRDKRGFYVSQLYSTTITPGHLAASFLRSRYSPSDEQEFWNSKMGLPHEVAGARISDGQLDAARGPHSNGQVAPSGDKLVTMGVDVGKWLHYEVCEWTVGKFVANDVNVNAVPRVIKLGKVKNFEDLDVLMVELGVHSCVIDAQPAQREAYRFSQRFWGFVKMCYYGRGTAGRLIQEHRGDEGEPLITVGRTSWLDQALGRFKVTSISLPVDVSQEYRDHLKAIVRIYDKDAMGNPVGSYVTENNRHDHYAHARCYAEIALALAAVQTHAGDIECPL